MRLLLSVLLFISITALFCAEIRDGKLWLEIHILNSKQIDLSTEGSFQISEIGSPLSGEFSGDVKLQIVAQDEQKMWGIINHIEVVNPDSIKLYQDENIREKFVWQDGKLAIQSERLFFENKYFTDLKTAEKYASETGYSARQICPVPMHSASLKVTPSKGKERFFQLPVQLRFSEDVSFNHSNNLFQGEFTIKPVKAELCLLNHIDIESYVAGVVPNEIGNLAPEEALKVQAVAARTHAVSLLLQNKHINDGYDLCSSTHCQVFKGNHLQNDEVRSAVLETTNSVLIYADRIADTVYHSSCGGKTETNQAAWNGKPISFLQGVACYPELESLNLSLEINAVKWLETNTDNADMSSWEKRAESWERIISRHSLASDNKVKNLHALKVLSRGNSGRIMKLKLIGSNEVTIEGEYKIRQALGGLPSSFFYVSNGRKTSTATYSLPEKIIIKGKGFGHGVGLCQVGALRKARAGWLWLDILAYYYPGVSVTDNWLDFHSEKR
ncbi:MAG: SpoIID/LytB domain-containing protein [Candidatus Cloacimonadaceae bacterium]